MFSFWKLTYKAKCLQCVRQDVLSNALPWISWPLLQSPKEMNFAGFPFAVWLFVFLSYTPAGLRYLWGCYSGIEQACPVFSPDPSISNVPSICSWLCRFVCGFFPPTFLKSDCYPVPCSGFPFLLVAQVRGLSRAPRVRWGGESGLPGRGGGPELAESFGRGARSDPSST